MCNTVVVRRHGFREHDRGWWAAARGIIPWVGLAIGVLILLYLCVIKLPAQLYPPLTQSDLNGIPNANDKVMLQEARLQLQNNARGTLLQGLAATFFVVTAYLGWQQLQNSRRQLLLERQGQITERFTKAAEQLGNNNTDVRLGGMYSLERIARDSSDLEYREIVAQVLIAFIRGRAPWPPVRPGQYIAQADIDRVPTLRSRAVDVQTALTILADEIFVSSDGTSEKLHNRSPSRRQLSWVDLRRANLWNAHMPGYWLEGTNFHKAGLRKADLSGANLQDTCLRDTNLRGANLQRANLQGASLHGADLTDAKLGNPYYKEIEEPVRREIQSSYWLPAEYPESRVTRMVGARADLRTRWPEDFDPVRAGVILE